MKKSYFFSALAAGMVLLSACSQDDDIANVGGGEVNSTEQLLVLQVPSTGGELQTRAGRPLYGSEAKQDIQNVAVIITDADNTVAYSNTIQNWMTDSEAYTDGGHGRKVTINLTNQLAAGVYKVYAIGYSNGSDYSLDAITSVTKGGTFAPNQVIALGNSAIGEEIFAGELGLTITKGEGFTQSVTLNRQVAGTFGYFGDIPFEEGAAKLQLVASQLNTALVLGQFSGDYVINGTTASSSNKVVYNIELSEWFTKIEDTDKDGLIDAANWQNPYAGSKDVAFKKGSVFGGSFVIPFAKTSGNTFTLQLTDEDNVPLRTWTVKLPNDDSQLKDHLLYTWTTDAGGSFVTTAAAKDDQTCYSVVRNHLYAIGDKKFDKKPGTGTDPDDDNPDGTDPDPDNTDDPESLDTKQELILRVNDNWAAIHQMEIEEKTAE